MVQIRRTPGKAEADFERAADGDTLLLWVKVADDVKVLRRCRLIGIDSFELHSADHALALDVREKIDALLTGRTLTVEATESGRDRYGRNLIKADLEGIDLATIFIRNGWAWPFGEADKKKHALKRHRDGVLAMAKVGVACIFIVLTFAACADKRIVYAPTTHPPTIATPHSPPRQDAAPVPNSFPVAASHSQDERPPVMCIIERGGQLTITGNDSPVAATDTSAAPVTRASWKQLATAAAAGAAIMLLIILGCHIGWRLIWSAAKATV